MLGLKLKMRVKLEIRFQNIAKLYSRCEQSSFRLKNTQVEEVIKNDNFKSCRLRERTFHKTSGQSVLKPRNLSNTRRKTMSYLTMKFKYLLKIRGKFQKHECGKIRRKWDWFGKFVSGKFSGKHIHSVIHKIRMKNKNVSKTKGRSH